MAVRVRRVIAGAPVIFRDGGGQGRDAGPSPRGASDPAAALASEIGVLAFKRGYAEWSESDRAAENGFAAYLLKALDELRSASA